jgi:hypothetical protein
LHYLFQPGAKIKFFASILYIVLLILVAGATFTVRAHSRQAQFGQNRLLLDSLTLGGTQILRFELDKKRRDSYIP